MKRRSDMVDIHRLIHIAEEAGHLIMALYKQTSVEMKKKIDNSIVTTADMAAHNYIFAALTALYPSIPLISEELVSQADYVQRKEWTYFFLIDPLDGTKEFIQNNDEFTVNIALVKKDQPILGVVHAPAFEITYYAEKNKGAYKIINNSLVKLFPQSKASNKLSVVTSRSHICGKTQAFLNTLASQGKEMTITAVGSALKFGWVADGRADIYLRLAPTMEWDTAAGQIIVEEMGKQVMKFGSDAQLKYNKMELVNPGFVVK